MSPATKRGLLDAWGGPLTADHIARRHHLGSGQVVRNFWVAEKAAGRLPDGPRPCFIEQTFNSAPPRSPAPHSAPEAPPSASDAEIDAPEDLSEAASLRIPAGDPLLEALYAVHDCDPRRAVDQRASEILATREGRCFPSAAGCAVSARVLDGAMKNVMKRIAA